MAADAVPLNGFFSVIPQAHGLGKKTGMKRHQIPCTVYPLPEKVIGGIVVRQMAVHALQRTVNTRHEPGLILVVHHVTCIAEFR
jgi:hypothetical protein